MRIQLQSKVLAVILCALCYSQRVDAHAQSEAKDPATCVDLSPDGIAARRRIREAEGKSPWDYLDFSPARRQRIRKQYQEELARLHSRNADNTAVACQLQETLLSSIGPEMSSQELVPLAEEWLRIYPQLPDCDKRFLAREALGIANLLRNRAEVVLKANNSRAFYPADAGVCSELGERMVGIVVQSAASEHWLTNDLLEARLLDVSADESFDTKTRAAARMVVENAGTPINRKAKALVVSLASARTKTDENTRQCLRKLTVLYPQLSKADQLSLAPNIVKAAVDLLSTPLCRDAEPLFWQAQRSAKSGRWLRTLAGTVDYDFDRAHLIYLNSRADYQAAEELLQTVVVIRETSGDTHDPLAACHARLALAYFLKKRGRLNEAKEQFELALRDAKAGVGDPQWRDFASAGVFDDSVSVIEREVREIKNPNDKKI